MLLPATSQQASLLRTLAERYQTLSETEREKARRLVTSLQWTAEHEALRLWAPHGGQEEFIADILKPDPFICISGAGNGWGKSEMLVAIFAAVLWPELAPAALQHKFFTDWRWPKQARIYSTPAELDDIGSLQTAIVRLFPKGRYLPIKGKYPYTQKIETDTGWVLDLFSYERDASEAAGPNISLQGINEPPPPELWKEIVARSRAGGIIIGGLTSLKENPWFVSGVLDKADGKSIRVRYGNSCENCQTHGKNGHLEHSNIVRILDQYPKDERDARFTGKPLTISGRIFKPFDQAVHVIPPMKPSGDVTVYQSVDPAGGKPLAVIYAMVNAAGIITIFDESPEEEFYNANDPGLDLDGYKRIFLIKETGFNVYERVIDRRYANARHKPGDKTLKEQFSDIGIDFVDSYHVAADKQEVQTGIQRVIDLLSWDKTKERCATNQPRLYITENCRNTISAIRQWSRDTKTLEPNDDGFKDFCDVVRYLVMQNPEHQAPRQDWNNVPRPFFGVNTAA